MHVVLGIDAAWTTSNPSGFAIAVKEGEGWRVKAVAASWPDFERLAFNGSSDRGNSLPCAFRLIEATKALTSMWPDVVAVDMPMARSSISGRRCSDNKISSVYGSRHCATHSPSSRRPGEISDQLREGFENLGIPLRTETFATPGLIEVYPHPAIVELTGAARRLPYKVGKIRSYWPSLDTASRRKELLAIWRQIEASLDREVSGVAEALQPVDEHSSTLRLKAYEDMLDAIVCTWVGICVLQGKATAFGDAESSIRVPSSKENFG